MANLVEGIQSQCNRCRELISQYEAIGPVGVFGKAVIQSAIQEGEAALASGDVVRMLVAYNDLQECE